MKFEQKRGISLIVLVITIIVMIILATAIVLTISGSEIFENTENAVSESDKASFKEAVQVEYVNWETATRLKKTDKTAIEYVKDKLADSFSEEWLNMIYIADSGEIILDDTNPNSAQIVLSSNESNIASSITAKVVQRDDKSGVNISNCKWIYTTTSTKLGTNASSYTGQFTNTDETITLSASEAGTYYLHVLTVDNVGRKLETISEAVTVSGALSQFSVQDCDTLTYSVVDNMSWNNFINSSYNDGKFSIDTDGGTDNVGKTYDYPIVTFAGEQGTDWLWLDGAPVNATTNVTTDATYAIGMWGVFDCEDDFFEW